MARQTRNAELWLAHEPLHLHAKMHKSHRQINTYWRRHERTREG